MVADGGQDGVEGGGHGQLLVGGGGVVERVGVHIHRRHQPRHRPAHRQPRSLGITGRHLKIEVSAMFRESLQFVKFSRYFIESSYTHLSKVPDSLQHPQEDDTHDTHFQLLSTLDTEH